MKAHEAPGLWRESLTYTAGIVLGLVAAIFLSASYVLSRLFVIRRERGGVQLLVAAHVIMGAVSLVAIPFAWPRQMPHFGAYATPLAGSVGFYLVAQAALFFALRRTDASRAAPLLGLKVPFLAVITVFLLHQPLGGMQWVAVAAAFVLNRVGGRIPAAALGGVLLACLSYCGSDLSIKALVVSLESVGQFRAVLLGVLLTYSFCGLVAVAVLPVVGLRVLREWHYAVPFAAAWFAAMLALYACFASVGVVLGSIVQSTRGLISIVMAAFLARAGLVHLERKLPAAVVVRRLAAAALMAGAISLYVLNAPPGR